MRPLINHVRSNAVAYIALFFAIGGGGGYAIAATVTSSNTLATIHSCVYRKTGELLVKSKCSKSESVLNLPHGVAQGLNSASAYVILAYNGAVNRSNNATVQSGGGPGSYSVRVSSAACPSSVLPLVEVTPIEGPPTTTGNSAPVAYVTGQSPQSIGIQLGSVQNGAYTPGQVGAYIRIDC